MNFRSSSVGIVGLGRMGSAMTEALRRAGYRVAVYDRREEQIARAVGRGAMPCDSIAAVAAAAAITAVVVADDEEVNEVAGAVLEVAAAGHTLLIHTTVTPATAVAIEKVAASQGIAVLEALVNGGVEAAQRGKLALMVGGDGETLLRCRPILEVTADQILHVGPVGAASASKLIANLLEAGGYALAIEAMALAESFGLDEDTMTTVLCASPADSRQLRIWGRHDRGRRERREAGLGWTERMGDDLREASTIGAQRGIDLPITATAGATLSDRLNERDRRLVFASAEPIPRCPVCDLELAAPFRSKGTHPECGATTTVTEPGGAGSAGAPQVAGGAGTASIAD